MENNDQTPSQNNDTVTLTVTRAQLHLIMMAAVNLQEDFADINHMETGLYALSEWQDIEKNNPEFTFYDEFSKFVAHMIQRLNREAREAGLKE